MEIEISTIHLYPGNSQEALVFPDVRSWEHGGGDYIRFETKDGKTITSTLPWFVASVMQVE